MRTRVRNSVRKSSLYCSLHGENKSHTSRKCKVLKARAKDKYNHKYGKNYYKKKFTEFNLLRAEAAHQKSKYENLNKAFTKKKTFKEQTAVLDNSSDSNSSPSSESENSPDENEKTSIAYDSYSADNEESSSSSISIEESNLLDGCRDAFIIDKLKPNSKSKIK